jgi:hypothetical protein
MPIHCRRPAVSTIVLGLALSVSGCSGPARDAMPREDWSAPAPSGTAALAAGVTFDGMQIAAENRGTERWRDVLIEVRRDPAGRVFHYRADVIVEGRRLPMGALNFEAADGRRLSPFEGAPTEWRISATLPDGRRGVAAGRIEAISPK